MHWRGTITRERERERQGEANREEEEMKKPRDMFETLHKDMVRALRIIRWFCSHWAQEPDDLQATSPRLAHTFIISDYVN